MFALALLLTPSPAAACGGFFCGGQPVDQEAERIVFAIDEEEGMVESHVQIFYKGEADEFAWVVPVPGEPELFLSTEKLFDALDEATQPLFRTTVFEQGTCSVEDMAVSSSAGGGASGGGGVTVVAEASVGPYDTAVLKANSSDALLTWLQDNDYDLPDDMESVLAPYVANDAHFVALRLQNDRTVDDIEPLGMRYPGTAAMIPIQLTSIAAVPDMRLEVYVMGEHRAVPDNYLHVVINQAAIDWTTNGANYNDVITRAADEAGGQAFATDMSAELAGTGLRGSVFDEATYAIDTLAETTDPEAFMSLLFSLPYPKNHELQDALNTCIPLPRETKPSEFYTCLSCFEEEFGPALSETLEDFDSAACAEAIDIQMLTPLRRAEAVFEHTTLTRLTSSVSPDEMTIDPMFVFNDVMGPVGRVYDAEAHYQCQNFENRADALIEMRMPDGRTILIPSENWFSEHGLSYADLLDEITTRAALIIESTSAEGMPEILEDYRDAVDAEIDAFNRLQEGPADEASAEGCGCSSSTAPLGSALWLLGLVGALARRRG
jgi:MYXO-CTERM domain-containing protein